MRRTLALLFIMIAALAAVVGTANADTDAVSNPAGVGWTLVPSGKATIQAFDCSAGDMCVWQNTSGTGPRCAWTTGSPGRSCRWTSGGWG